MDNNKGNSKKINSSKIARNYADSTTYINYKYDDNNSM